MAGETDGAEIEGLVAQVLSSFDLAGCERDARWRGQVKDLRQILAADYRGTVRTYYEGGIFPLRSLIRDAARDFPTFNVNPIQFDSILLATLSSLGIKLRLQKDRPRLTLRGFYLRDRKFGAVIWVNQAHHPGAVAASLAHELGHWYRERLLGCAADGSGIPFFNTNFADHLTRPAELFADLFVVLAAYPTAAAQRIFPAGSWRQAVKQVLRIDQRTLARLRNHMNVHYGFDGQEQRAEKIPRRIYYLTSMLHFARLRWALLQEFHV